MADNGWRRNKYGGWFNINDIENKSATNKYMNDKLRNSVQNKNEDKEVQKRERATRMYLDGEIDKSELIEDYFGGNKEGAEEYINDENEYKLYKKAREDESSIDPMTENSTDWEALDKKYNKRYKKEENLRKRLKEWMYDEDQIDYAINDLYYQRGYNFHEMTDEMNSYSRHGAMGEAPWIIKREMKEYYKKENLGEPKNFKRGQKVLVQDDYSGQYSKEYEVVREANKEEKKFKVNSNLKAYILKDENGNEIVKADIRLKEINGSNSNDNWIRNAFNEYKKQHPGTKMTLEDFRKQNK